MKIQHTPGPWSWDENILRPPADSPRISTIFNDDGCMVYRNTPVSEFEAEIEANKRLIAAAPDLLDALEAMFNEYGDFDYSPGMLNNARAAIAKAKGESA